MSYWSHPKPTLRTRAVEVEALAQASVELLQEGGPRALTIRAVAARIGVAPPSLYSRVESVHDLFDLALDHALGTDKELTAAIERAGIYELMIAYYQHLLRNHWACQVIPMRPPRGPNYLYFSERMCVLLEESGEADPLSAAYAVSNYVLGNAATIGTARDEPRTPIDRSIAPTYARLRAQHEVLPESILTKGLAALLRHKDQA